MTPSQPERVAEFLRRRAEPVSSRLLAQQFLAMTVDSEQMATRLVGPMMESAGARYAAGVGWSLRNPSGAAGASGAMVAAAADLDSGEVALADPAGGAVVDLSRATVVMMTPAREAGSLRSWLARHRLAQPASIVSLQGAARRLLARASGRPLRVPRGADLSRICGLLGVRWLDTGDAVGAARAIAACLAEMAARRPGDIPAADAAPGPELPPGITPEMLEALPRSPGVYRFYDEAGSLLYAGKARDLRRRVSSYFTAGAVRAPRRFYSKIHRFDVTLAGTEIEALLGEARLIARHLPGGNVQVQVHERPASNVSARACALLLPRADRRGVTAIVMRDGRYLGRAAIGPRGGGLAAAKKWIGLALAPRPRARTVTPLGKSESEILRSWLGRHGESVCRLDLDGFGKADAAMKALRRAVADLLTGGGTEPVVYRSDASPPKLTR